MHGIAGLLWLALALIVRHRGDAVLSLPHGWAMGAQSQSNALVLLVLATICSQLAAFGWARLRERSLPGPVSAALLLVLIYLALVVSPRPITVERRVALTPDVGNLGPILAHQTRYLTPPSAWLRAKGAPLNIPDAFTPQLYLFRVQPDTDTKNVGFMSCANRTQQRTWLTSGDTAINLPRADLPVGVHLPAEALSRFCIAGKRLDPALAARLDAAARERLERLSGPVTTTFDPFEIGAAQGRIDIVPGTPHEFTSRGRYLLFLSQGQRSRQLLPPSVALYTGQDYFYAANQCDAEYAQFLLAMGVPYPDRAARYLRMEIDGLYEHSAQLERPAEFPYGLAPKAGPIGCRDTLVLLDKSDERTSGLPRALANLF
ncbi:hypothetical protein RBI22_22910 [Alcaligenaceae bacterium C4P045]|nr:hypothetical protein [Alcaligenaceae bacterium C4P045]